MPTASGSGGSLDAARPELEWGRGVFDVPHSFKLSTVVQLPFGEGRRWLNTRHRQPDPGRLARRSHSVVLFRQTARCDEQCATSDFQLDKSPERDGGRLACANSRRRVQPARGQVPESGRVRPARRRIGQCSSRQRRCADSLGHERKREPGEVAEADIIAERGCPGGGIQRVQSRPLGNPGDEFQLERVWPNHEPGE